MAMFPFEELFTVTKFQKYSFSLYHSDSKPKLSYWTINKQYLKWMMVRDEFQNSDPVVLIKKLLIDKEKGENKTDRF